MRVTPGKQKGVALIMVLMAMALIVVLATGMIDQQSIRLYRASHYLAQQQGYTIATGAEAFARSLLYRDFQEDQETGGLVDSSDEFWARYALVLPMDIDGVVELQIDDLGGRINLNNLVSANGEVNTALKGQVGRLLARLGITTVSVEAMIDWIDRDTRVTGSEGAEDTQYRVLSPANRAANQPFAAVSELRWLPGMTADSYQLLRPHVAALPRRDAGINVNTATVPVLLSLSDQLTERQVSLLAEQRDQAPFASVSEFRAQPMLEGVNLSGQGLSVHSNFFEVVSRITYAGREVHMVSTVFRQSDGEVRTLHRDTGQTGRITREPYTFSEG